jgi:hypothetical protein
MSKLYLQDDLLKQAVIERFLDTLDITLRRWKNGKKLPLCILQWITFC